MSMLDPIMNPFLAINPFIAILSISLVLSLLITIIYKYMTDQELMKTLKEDIKAAQKEMKLLKDNPEKLIAMQKKAMDKNMKYMMHSMKPTLITFIPILLIFGWLNANFAYEPILPGQEFNIEISFNQGASGYIEAFPPKVSNSIELQENNPKKDISINGISYKFKALGEGDWEVIFKVNNLTEYKKAVTIDSKKYAQAIETGFEGKEIKQIKVGYPKKIVLDIFGWKLGWLGAYIIFSIIFSMGLRKILKLH